LTPGAHGWERNKEQTRLSLVRAAVSLFRDRGFEATTVDDITTEAGCSRRTFFRYFGTKEDVLLLDTRKMLVDFRAPLLAEPVPGLSRWDQIRQGLQSTIRRLAEPNSGVEELTIAAWLHEPAIARHFSVILSEVEKTVAETLAEECQVDPDGDLRIQVIARTTSAACTAALHVHVKTHAALETLFDGVFSMLENGITGSLAASTADPRIV
jgi:AcrR family transcriptional regulator